MKGLLIVNNFVYATKFSELYDLLCNSAKQLEIYLDVKKTGNIPHNLDYINDEQYDFILFWDKDTILANMFEVCGYRVFNSSNAIMNCDNKANTSVLLQKSKVRTPKTFIAPLTFEGLGYNDLTFANSISDILGYPMIIKELYGSFGQQVYMVKNADEMKDIITKLGHKGFLMQEYIESSRGRDIRINVVGDRVISSMLRYNEHGDFRSNISNGGSMKKYDINEDQQMIAIEACKALNLDFAGVDVMFGKNDEPIICEVNSNPHFKSTLQCTGVDMSFEILSYIKREMLR